MRISMGEGFVTHATHVLCELRRKHPALRIELISETRLVDLARREADAGIRKVRSSSPVLVERAVGRLRFALYASHGYVERRLRGDLLRAGDFERHDFIEHHGALARLPQGAWLAARGAKRFVFRSNSDFAIQEAIEQGQGIGVIADAQRRSVTGLVQLVLDDAVPALPTVPAYLVFHKELRRVPRCRLVLDALDAALRKGLA